MKKGAKILIFTTITVLLLYFSFKGLSNAKAFLAPFTTAMILSLVVFPLSRKMERAGMARSWASLLNTFLLLLISLGLMVLISFQIKSFVNDWPQIKNAMQPKVEQLKSFAFDHTPYTKEDLNQTKEGANLPFGDPGNVAQKAYVFFSGFMGFLGTFLLVFIYIFFMLNYRARFRKFILKLFPDEKKQKVEKVIKKSAKIAPEYLVGKLLLMGGLAIVYSIGLGISGVNNFILVSIIAALLTLIPYIGNIIGTAMALVFGYLTTGETSVLIGVIITFSVAQLIENYVLQPYVIGDKVDVHPFWVIVVVIIGNLVWGVLGMILAIPVLAIFTVIFLHVPQLKPFGFLFSKK